ncbi:Fic family protein [Methylobacterium sp. 174MFSha1.1]|uniref:Fic family protein n=1 Tax=Methylobacterium sp. 174MFSha1.1 TaxID=1502749 RepID=UPI0008EC6706|nr:Fic/DOC family N-terminal domain-containing protein [Methylobacterium sp. 174MFSha1.1]SFV16052.1 Fic family protein [Methylobacterium sp. 174MFSha1.1]
MNRQHLAHAVRERLVRLPAPYDNHYGVVPAPPPEDVSCPGILDRLVAASAALAQVRTIAQEMADPYLISRVLTRREAVSSSAIEGTHSTLDELLAVDDAGEPDAMQRGEVRQVRDYALSLDRLLPQAREHGPAIFDLDLIRRLHAEVMRSDPDFADVPGEWRRSVVWIGGTGNIAYSTWNPPPPDRIAGCLAETVDYLRNEGRKDILQAMTQNLVVRMAVAHAHFEAVHPFRDGNGRVGRLLLPLMMAAEGEVPLYLSPYIDAHKEAYYAALKGAQQRLDWAAMIGFVSDAVAASVDELMVTRQALAGLRNDWAARRRFRHGSASLRTLDLLPHYPVLTVRRLASLLAVTVPQAGQAVDQLVAAGILSERTGYARNRIFAAGEVLAIVNRPFGAAPILPGPDGEDDGRLSDAPA